MAKKRWNDLSPTVKAAIIGVIAMDSALGLLTSSGVLPVAYLTIGRKS